MAKKDSKKTGKTAKKAAPKKAASSKAPSKKTSGRDERFDQSLVFELKLIVFFLLSVALAVSVHGFPMGIVGEATRDILSGLFSVSMYFIPYFFMAILLTSIIGKIRRARKRYLFALLALFIAQTLLVGFYSRAAALPLSLSFADISKVYVNGTKFIGAGLLGNLIFVPIYGLLGYAGTLLCIIALSLVFLILASRFQLSELMLLFGKGIKKTGEKAMEGRRSLFDGGAANEAESDADESLAKKPAAASIDLDHIDWDKVERLEELGGFGEFDYEKAVRAWRKSSAAVGASVYDDASDFYERSSEEFKFIDIPGSKASKLADLSVPEAEQASYYKYDDALEERGLSYSEAESMAEEEGANPRSEGETEPPEGRIEEEEALLEPAFVIQRRKPEEKPESTEIAPLRQAERREGDEDYVLPSFDLLIRGESSKSEESEIAIMNKAAILEETFRSFKVEASVTSAVQGPMITRFEVKPRAGVKISKIAALSDDIAMRLAATNVRILAPIPGKSAVGIEVPNDNISMVRLREVLESKAYANQASKIKFGLGKDISGEEIVADLAKMPHLLIAGATGSGKSVCVNTIISSILFNAKPSEVKFLMIDPKVVELSVYNGIPHLLLPVVTDPNKASVALSWAVNEMTQRYAKFAEYRVKDINSYNEKYEEWKRESEALREAEEEIRENGILEEDFDAEAPAPFDEDAEDGFVYKVVNEEPEAEMEFMPRIVIIIDELADLMVVAGKQVEESIARIAQMARAAGMHLIVATQRPSVDVITGLIKANIPSRIAFAVSSQIDSRTILDEQGADKLLGKGDMLFLSAGKSKPTRVQGALVTDHEVEALVDYVKQQYDGELEYNESVVDGSHLQDYASGEDGESDELLDAAIQFVIRSEKASTSMIQRKFRIGYNRAARIIEEMEEKGVVGPSRGAKPREVLISGGHWESEDYDA